MKYCVCASASAILVIAGTLVYAAPRSARVQKETPSNFAPQPDVVTPDPEVGEDWRVTAELQEDGSWAIAGVVGFSKDEFGRNVIEVKKDGDFETDAVLQLFVPLVELDTGEVVAGGIVSVKNNGDTLTLTVREPGTLNGKGQTRALVIQHDPTPTPLNGCEGVLNNGQFQCARDTSVCTNDCVEKDIHNGSTTICDCGSGE